MNTKILSGNTLKIIAAIAMLIDHIGMMFFPKAVIFRIIGRLAFPIFAFMIAESAKYTKNKLKHFMLMFSLAFVCQVVYYLFDNGSLYMCILVTFSISTLLIYTLQRFNKALFKKDAKATEKIFWGLIFFLGVVATYLVCNIKYRDFVIDYGFAGCMTPVAASLLDFSKTEAPRSVKRLDTIPLRVLCMILPIAIIVYNNIINGKNFGIFLFATLILLLFYSGKRGKRKLKYFFYIFYPLHLVILEGIYMLIN